MNAQAKNLAPKRLRQQTVVADSAVPWTAIREVLDTPALMLLFVSKRYALIVHKRAFAYPSEAATFVRLAHKYWSAAHGTVLGVPGSPGDP